MIPRSMYVCPDDLGGEINLLVQENIKNPKLLMYMIKSAKLLGYKSHEIIIKKEEVKEING